MNLFEFAKRTHILRRLRRAMIMFWQPLILLAGIPIIITLAASLPFAVNFILVIIPFFGVASYFAYIKYGMTGLVSVSSVSMLGSLLNLIPAIGQILSRKHPDQIDQIEGFSATLVVLIVMVVLFGAWAYIGTRMLENSGNSGMVVVTIIVVFVIISLTLGL
jgi:hypothetical protein